MGNVPAWLRILVAGWPAVAFLGGTLLAHQPPSAAKSEPAREQATRPAINVPDPLLAHARKVAADHHARTGHPIDAATLRARLGVPAPLADAIAERLT